MVKIYTKTGDDGTTGLIDGKRIRKSNPRIIAYGTVDELNSIIGVICALKVDSDISILLTIIQNDLFVVGADLANPDLQNKSFRTTDRMVQFLEESIDKLEKDLSPISFFILPGGDLIASYVHMARTISRRAEVNIVQLAEIEEINKTCQIYMNRLSDLFFVIARVINKRKMINDIAWKSKDTL